MVDLNSFARRKDGISFALNLSLFSSNTDQLVTLLQSSSSWNSVQIVDLSLIIFSLGLQLGWHSLAIQTLAIWTLAMRQLPFEDSCHLDTCHS